MDLFIIEEQIVKPNPQALLISVFNDIWNRDKTKKKERAIKEFSYIEFMCSFRKTNPFIGYEEKERHYKLSKDLFGEENYEPDDKVKDAMSYYTVLQEDSSPSLRMYKAVVNANDKLIDFANNVDLRETDNKGTPKWKPSDITSITSKAYENIKSLQLMREKVEQELFEATKTRANREINHFEMKPRKEN